MKKKEQLKKVDQLIELMTQYMKLAMNNKESLDKKQIRKAKQVKENFLVARRVKANLEASLKKDEKEKAEQSMDAQTRKFMEEAQKMLDTFDTEMKSLQETIQSTMRNAIKGGKALLSKIF